MPQYVAISRQRHADKGWKRYASYAFAAGDAVAPLVLQELPRALMHFPIALIRSQNDWLPAAVQGLVAGQNLFVAPDGGWLGGYVPAVYRGFPFALANTSEDQRVLCIDEDSGLVVEASAGEPFFDERGEPAQSVREVLGFLEKVDQNRVATRTACGALDEAGLLHSWGVKVKTADGERRVDGLFCVDEQKFNGLAPDALKRLQQTGALTVAYCQMLSRQHLQRLGTLAKVHAKAQPASPPENLGELFGEGGEETLKFNF